MAATDMSKAGLEPGCKVNLPHGRHGVVRAIESGPEYHRLTPRVVVESMGRCADYRRSEVQRDYEDAQAERHKRFDQLYKSFPGDAGVPEDTDTIERFCCVQKNVNPAGDGAYAFIWSDDFDEVASEAGGQIFDGWWPEGVFDLDTGAKIDVHVSSPVITRSEDQGATINELDAGEVAENKAYVAEHYDHVADNITVSITCAPRNTDRVAALLHEARHQTGVEHFQINVEPVRQLRHATTSQEA